MSVRIRVTNESAFTHGEARVQVFQGPPIVEGEHGLARPVERRALSVGESHAFTLEDGMYISVEEVLRAESVPHHLPAITPAVDISDLIKQS